MELLWICLLYIVFSSCKSFDKGTCNVGVYIPGVKLGGLYDLTNQFNGQTVECRKTLYFPSAVSLTITITDIVLPVVKRVEYIGINTGQRQTTISGEFIISSGECDGVVYNSVSFRGKSALELNNTEYVCLKYFPPKGLDQSGPLYGDYGPHPLKISLHVELTAVVCNISELALVLENSTSFNSSCFMVCTKYGAHYRRCKVTSPHTTTFVVSKEQVSKTEPIITVDYTVQVHQTIPPYHLAPVHPTTSVVAHFQPNIQSTTNYLKSKLPMYLKSSEHPFGTTTDSNYNKMSLIIEPTTKSKPLLNTDKLHHLGSTVLGYKTTINHVLRPSTRLTEARSSNNHYTISKTISKTTSSTLHRTLTHSKNTKNVKITSLLTTVTILTGGHLIRTSLSTDTLTPQSDANFGVNAYRTASHSNINHHGLTQKRTLDVKHRASNSATVPNIIFTSTISMDNTNDLLMGLYATSGLAAVLFTLLIICCCCSCTKRRQDTVLGYSTEDVANMSADGVHVCGQWKTNWIMKPKFVSNYNLQRHLELPNTDCPSENDLVTHPREDRLIRLQSSGSQTTDMSYDHTHNSKLQNEESVYDNIGVVIPRTHTESEKSHIQTQTDFDQKQKKYESCMSSDNNQSSQTEISKINMNMDGCQNKTQINDKGDEQEKKQN